MSREPDQSGQDPRATIAPESPAPPSSPPPADAFPTPETIAPGEVAATLANPQRVAWAAQPSARDGLVEGYVKLGVLGEGGMGVVWKAEQLGTKRIVALKMISGSFLGSDRIKLRFEREVELAAKLEHPNIARIYASGVSDAGLCFCAMELVKGASLTKYAAERKLQERERVELMLRVCEGVRYAHERGVIHRDLKPSNILVADDDGTPKLLDFGLAKVIGEGVAESGLTVSGEVVGTPAYMPPEQARGETASAGTRGDVWSLGVILFELLTGSMPYDVADSYVGVLRRVADEEPRRPRSVCPSLDGELEAILVKCLSRDAAARYATAGEMAQDLRRFLDGEPLAARPPTALYFLRKRVARHKLAFSLAALAVALAIGAVAFYVRSLRIERDNTREAKRESDENLVLARNRGEQAAMQRAAALVTIRTFILRGQQELNRSAADARLREILRTIALEGLDKISEASNETAKPDRDLAATTVVMGDIARAAGDPARAERLYRQAIRHYGAARADAARPDDERLEIITHVRLARILVQRDDRKSAAVTAEAEAELTAAERLLAPMLGLRPNDPALLRDQWGVLLARGEVALAANRPADALKACEQARSLAAKDPPFTADDRALAQRRVAAACAALATSAKGEFLARARTEATDAVAADRARLAADAASPDAQWDLALSLLQAARLSLASGDKAAAARDAAEARHLIASLSALRPDDVGPQLDLAEALLVEMRATAPPVPYSMLSIGRDCLSRLEGMDPGGTEATVARLKSIKTNLATALDKAGSTGQ